MTNGDNGMMGSPPYWYEFAELDGPGQISVKQSNGETATKITVQYAGKGSFIVYIEPTT